MVALGLSNAGVGGGVCYVWFFAGARSSVCCVQLAAAHQGSAAGLCTHLMQIGPVNIAVGWGLAGAGCQLTATGICRLKAMQLIPPVIAQCVQVLVGSGWRLCSCAAAMAA